MQERYLQHHGVYGQKWGVRRFQNPDGTLTAAGRRRYQVGKEGTINDISTKKGIKRRLADVDKANTKNRIARNKSSKNKEVRDKYDKNYKQGTSEVKSLETKAKDIGMNVGTHASRYANSQGKKVIPAYFGGIFVTSLASFGINVLSAVMTMKMQQNAQDFINANNYDSYEEFEEATHFTERNFGSSSEAWNAASEYF